MGFQGLKMSENGDFWCPGANRKISNLAIFGLREGAQHYMDPKVTWKKVPNWKSENRGSEKTAKNGQKWPKNGLKMAVFGVKFGDFGLKSGILGVFGVFGEDMGKCPAYLEV